MEIFKSEQVFLIFRVEPPYSGVGCNCGQFFSPGRPTIGLSHCCLSNRIACVQVNKLFKLEPSPAKALCDVRDRENKGVRGVQLEHTTNKGREGLDLRLVSYKNSTG